MKADSLLKVFAEKTVKTLGSQQRKSARSWIKASMRMSLNRDEFPERQAKHFSMLELARCPMTVISVLLAFVCIIYAETHADIGFLSILFLAVFFIVLGLLAYYVARLFYLLIRFEWLRAAGVLIAAAMLAGALTYGHSLTDSAFKVIDAIRFSLTRSHYESEVLRRLGQDGPTQTISFDWGSGGFLSTNFFYSLVYREADSIDASLDLSSDRCKSSARRLAPKFFLVSVMCQ